MWKDLIVYDMLPGRYIINDKGFIIPKDGLLKNSN